MSVAEADTLQKSREFLSWIKHVAGAGFVRYLPLSKVAVEN